MLNANFAKSNFLFADLYKQIEENLFQQFKLPLQFFGQKIYQNENFSSAETFFLDC